jgi:hypothetical protein
MKVTAQSSVKWFVVPGFSYHFFCFPEDEFGSYGCVVMSAASPSIIVGESASGFQIGRIERIRLAAERNNVFP